MTTKSGRLRGGPRNVSTDVSAIPDSVVSRQNDDHTSTGNTTKRGLRFETSVEWPKIGGTISANTSGVTRAYIYRVSDGSLLGETDISGLSAGDSFTIEFDNPIESGDTYQFVADAEGSSYDQGYRDVEDISFPVTSNDGNLSITDGAGGNTSTNSGISNIVTIGNVGFD